MNINMYEALSLLQFIPTLISGPWWESWSCCLLSPTAVASFRAQYSPSVTSFCFQQSSNCPQRPSSSARVSVSHASSAPSPVSKRFPRIFACAACLSSAPLGSSVAWDPSACHTPLCKSTLRPSTRFHSRKRLLFYSRESASSCAASLPPSAALFRILYPIYTQGLLIIMRFSRDKLRLTMSE